MSEEVENSHRFSWMTTQRRELSGPIISSPSGPSNQFAIPVLVSQGSKVYPPRHALGFLPGFRFFHEPQNPCLTNLFLTYQPRCTRNCYPITSRHDWVTVPLEHATEMHSNKSLWDTFCPTVHFHSMPWVFIVPNPVSLSVPFSLIPAFLPTQYLTWILQQDIPEEMRWLCFNAIGSHKFFDINVGIHSKVNLSFSCKYTRYVISMCAELTSRDECDCLPLLLIHL